MDGGFLDAVGVVAAALDDDGVGPLARTPFPAASTASSIASVGTHDASTPSEIQSAFRLTMLPKAALRLRVEHLPCRRR